MTRTAEVVLILLYLGMLLFFSTARGAKLWTWFLHTARKRARGDS